MKDIILSVVVLALIAATGFLFLKIQTLETKVAEYDSKVQFWDMAVEILEDCMEYNTLGECKQRYPQYRELFQ